MNDPDRYHEELIALADSCHAAGKELFAVGGCVRDALLGEPVHDIDVTGSMPPWEMKALLDSLTIPYVTVNERLGTLLLWPDTHKIEYTAFRTESYGAGGAHTPDTVAFTDDIRKDALRRDFSVNALYRNLRTRELIDPTHGYPDLMTRTLRTATDDPAVILRDDGLRILRLVRFSARLRFSVEEKTLACAKAYAPLLENIAWERKREELLRILAGERVVYALELLRDIGALPYIIPALTACDSVQQRADYHRYDVLTHCFHVCAQTPNTPVMRLAGLLHDVGKPAAIAQDGTMHGHDILGERICRDMLRQLRCDNGTVDGVCFLVRRHMFDLDGRAKEETLRRRFCMWGEKRTEQLIALREADVRGSGVDTGYCASRWRNILDEMRRQGVPFEGEGLAVTGADIMRATGLSAGAAVGRIKHALILHCAVRPRDNTRDRLCTLAVTLQKDTGE